MTPSSQGAHHPDIRSSLAQHRVGFIAHGQHARCAHPSPLWKAPQNNAFSGYIDGSSSTEVNSDIICKHLDIPSFRCSFGRRGNLPIYEFIIPLSSDNVKAGAAHFAVNSQFYPLLPSSFALRPGGYAAPPQQSRFRRPAPAGARRSFQRCPGGNNVVNEQNIAHRAAASFPQQDRLPSPA